MEPSDGMDTLTRLNTELNKSMTLTDESPSKTPTKLKKRKSLIIDTSINSNTSVLSTPGSSRLSDSISPRKSILKTPGEDELESSFIRVTESTPENEENEPLESTKIIERPRSLEELVQKESLKPNTMSCAFNLTDLDEDDELWVINIPKSINPQDLKGQIINFGDKSKLKVGGDRFVAVPSSGPDCFTCILGTGKERKAYKAVNIKSNGTIVVRKKLPGPLKRNFDSQETSGSNNKVPFPTNLKIRHPLLGVVEEKKKKKKRSKKHSMTK